MGEALVMSEVKTEQKNHEKSFCSCYGTSATKVLSTSYKELVNWSGFPNDKKPIIIIGGYGPGALFLTEPDVEIEVNDKISSPRVLVIKFSILNGVVTLYAKYKYAYSYTDSYLMAILTTIEE